MSDLMRNSGDSSKRLSLMNEQLTERNRLVIVFVHLFCVEILLVFVWFAVVLFCLCKIIFWKRTNNTSAFFLISNSVICFYRINIIFIRNYILSLRRKINKIKIVSYLPCMVCSFPKVD